MIFSKDRTNDQCPESRNPELINFTLARISTPARTYCSFLACNRRAPQFDPSSAPARPAPTQEAKNTGSTVLGDPTLANNPLIELSTIKALLIAALPLVSVNPKKIRIGLKKTPPPIPIIPDTN